MTVGVQSHVSVNGREYLIKPFSYAKRAAPQFGARFSTGDPDFNNLSIWQHWSQRCWIGGVDQDDFADDAMYDEGIGVDTTAHEVANLSRDLARGTGSNWAVGSGTTATSAGYKAIVFNNILYVLGLSETSIEGELWQYFPVSDGWSRVTSLDAANITPRSIATFDGKLFIGGANSTSAIPKLVYSSGALSSWTSITNPAGVSGAVYAMRSFQQKLYVAFKTYIWRLKDDQTWDGNTVFYKADQNSDSNYMIAMETHLGFLYMLSQNGHIHRTDGNATFDLWSWDGQTYGRAIKSFDGRLFIMTFEFTNTADVGQGVLYQMSGSAVTQLKRWGDDTQATSIPSMVVYDRKMFYGASNLLGFGSAVRSGFGVAAYDPIEDAHSIVAANSATGTYAKGVAPYVNYIVDDVIFFQGKLFAFVRGHGAFFTPYKNRDRESGVRRYDITNASGALAPLNGGWFTTSTYDAGTPGVKKLWRKIAVDTTIKTNTGIVVEYSVDNGTNWSALTGISAVATRTRTEFFLNNVISTSLKLRFTLRSTSSTATPELYGFVVSYIPVPEPNWLWTFTIPLSVSQKQMDGSIVSMDTENEMALLSTAYRTKSLIPFIDIDGTEWATGGSPGVLIYDIEFRVSTMGQPLEGEVVITLIEAVETY